MNQLWIVLSFLLIVRNSLEECLQDVNCLACLDGTRCLTPLQNFFITNELISMKMSSSQCIIGQKSSPRLYKCTKCISGMYPRSVSCISCINQNCETCNPNSPQKCTSYKIGSYLVNDNCVGCSISNCYLCSNNSYCPPCPNSPMDYLTYLNSSCLLCLDPICVHCPNNPNFCTGCNRKYFPNQNGICEKCRNNCRTCLNDSICLTCDQRYGLFVGQLFNVTVILCLPCPSNCSICQTSTQCKYCNAGLGLLGNSCVPCEILNCIQCSSSPTICDRCKINFGLTSVGLCSQCADKCYECGYNISYCYRCGDSTYNLGSFYNGFCLTDCYFEYCDECENGYFHCTKCDQSRNLGLEVYDHITYCSLCIHQNCTNCRNDYSYCIECKGGQGAIDGDCKFCFQPECLNCSLYIFSCSLCSKGFYLNVSFCTICPDTCTECFLSGQVKCTFCIYGYEVIGNDCVDICGDGIIFEHDCDNSLNVDYDGCDNSCQFMDNFTCQTISGLSVCSYNETIDLRFVSFSKKVELNMFELIIKVWPPLNIFKLSSQQQIFQIFKILNEEFVLKRVSYNINDSTVRFEIQVTNEIVSQSFKIGFEPFNSIQAEYFATPSVNILIPFDFSVVPYYSESDMVVTDILKKICMIVMIGAWITFIIGMFGKNLAGLEAMFVVQFSWLTLMWSDSPFILPYFSFVILKYSVGYNYNKIMIQQDSRNMSINPKFSNEFQLNRRLFVNNFNCSFVFFLVVLVFLVVYKIVLRHKERNRGQKGKGLNDSYKQECVQSNNVKNGNETEKKVLCIEISSQNKQQQQIIKENGLFETFLPILLQLTFFSLIYVINCSVLFLSMKNYQNVVNMMVMIISMFLLLMVLVKFYFDPDPFDYFRYSFKVENFAMNHYFVHFVVISLATILLCVFASQPFICIIPLGLMLLFTIIYRPYLKFKDNLRSVFNYSVMCSFVGFKIFAHISSQSVLTQNFSFSFLLFNSFLLLIVIVVSIIFHIQVFIERKRLEKFDGMDVDQENKATYEILKNLVKTDMNQKIGKIRGDNFFKDFVSPNQSVLSMSTQLKNLRKLIKMNNNIYEQYERDVKLDNDNSNERVDRQKQVMNDGGQVQIEKKDIPISQRVEQILVDQNNYIKYKRVDDHWKNRQIQMEFVKEYNNIQ